MSKQTTVGWILLVLILALFGALLATWPVATQSGAPALLKATIDEAVAEADVEKKDQAARKADEEVKKKPEDATLKKNAADASTDVTNAKAALAAVTAKKVAAEVALKANPQVADYTGYWTALDGISLEVRLMLVVMVVGALGSVVHAARAFAVYIGRGSYKESWTWWYFLRVPTGAALALLVYFVLKAGLITGNPIAEQNAASNVNIYGFAALAALAGLFSNQAFQKLEETFNTFFRTATKAGEFSSGPVVASVSRAFVGATGEGLIVTVRGRNFDADVKARINDKDRQIKSWTATELKVELNSEDVKQPGQLKLLTFVPKDKGGGEDEAQIDVVVRPPAPVIDKVTPIVVGAAGDGLVATVQGRNFVDGLRATINGKERALTFFSPTELKMKLDPGDVAQQGQLKLVISNPEAKGGGESEISVAVVAGPPAPVVEKVGTAKVGSSGGDLEIPVSGRNFDREMKKATVDGQERKVKFQNATEVKVVLLVADVATARTAKLKLFNPEGKGGASAEADLKVA